MDNNKTLKIENYSLCEFCKARDPFIVDVADKVSLSNKKNSIKHKKQFYVVEVKSIQNTDGKEIEKGIFFIDVTKDKQKTDNMLLIIFILFFISISVAYFILRKYITATFFKLEKASHLLESTNDAVYLVKT